MAERGDERRVTHHLIAPREQPFPDSPHGLAVHSRGDVYVGEVSFTKWRNRYGSEPPPAGLRSLQKLVKV